MFVRTRPVRSAMAVLAALLVSTMVAVLDPPAAEAVVITVARTDDPAPGTPGQCGSPASDDSNDCSLRQAVRRANDLAGPDEVVVPAGTFTLSIVGDGEDDAATGDIDVLDDLTITGAGRTMTTISGAGMHLGTPDRLLHVPSGDDLTITGVTMTLGEADFGDPSTDIGGAIRNDGGTLAIADSLLTENSSGSGGGAVATIDGTTTITSTTLSDNMTGTYGGALLNFASTTDATMTLRDVIAEDNVSSQYGGAAANEAEGTVTATLLVEDSTMRRNIAEGCCGGAIIADDAEYGSGGAAARTVVVIRGSTLTANEGRFCCGGAVYAEGTNGDDKLVIVTIEDSSLDENSAEGPGDDDEGCCGGAIYTDDASLTVSDSSLSSNTDDGCCGGALYLQTTDATFTRTRINDNIEESDPDDTGGCCGGAGGIYQGSKVTFTDSEIRSNSVDACCGGAFDISSSDTEVTFLRTTIADNTSAECCGGGMQVSGGATVRLIDSSLIDNRETTGSAVPTLGGGGGGIAVYNDASTLEVVNSTVSGNSTAETGGGILAVDGTVTIVHSTITGNTATVDGSALAVGDPESASSNPTVTVVNSIVDGTCLVAPTATFDTTATNVLTDASCDTSPARAVVTDAGLLPLVEPAGTDGGIAPPPFHPLAVDSPALDAATSANPDPVTADQRGVPRPLDGDDTAGAVADIGAVEARFVDVAATIAVGDDQIVRDEEFDVTIGATSAGPETATIVVTLPVPDGFVVDEADTGCIVDNDTVTCATGGSTAPGGSESFDLTLVGDTIGAADLTVQAASSDLGAEDRVPANDETEATIDVLPPWNALRGGVDRLAGDSRLETATAISQRTWPDGAAGAVVLARADQFPDALAGTPLAVQEEAPLLLTAPDALDPITATEIQRVLPAGGTVYLLGGDVALNPAVQAAVEALGYTTVRYAGETRFDTAVTIAEEALDEVGTVYLVTGRNFPDAVAAGAATAVTDGAVLLTDDATMPTETASYLGSLASSVDVFAVGGPAAGAQSGDVDLIGADRFATALLVAQRFFDDPPVAGVATGRNFPDALTGGAQVGIYGGPMLLSDTTTLPSAVGTYLGSLPDDATVYLYGGTVALSADVETAIDAARAR